MTSPETRSTDAAGPLQRFRQSRRGPLQLEARAQQREYDAITARIAADRPGHILDWGCGHGQVSALLRGHGIQTTSFEYRPELAGPTEQALERYPEIVAQISPEPVALPYADDSFDAVLSCGVLEHVSDPAASLDELHRVLKPGGTLYVYKLPNRFSWLEWLARRLGLMHHGSQPFDKLYGKRDSVELLRAHGYEVGEFRRANMLPLTVRGDFTQRHSEGYWRLNAALSRIPGLNLLATNVELVARAGRGR